MAAYEKIYAALAQSLVDDIIHANEPSAGRTLKYLTSIRKESANKRRPITVEILKNTKIGKVLKKTVKVCARQKISLVKSAASDEKDIANIKDWDKAIDIAEALLTSFKSVAEEAGCEEPSALKQKTTKAKQDVSNLTVENNKQKPRASSRPRRTIKSVDRFDSKFYDDAKKKALENQKQQQQSSSSENSKNNNDTNTNNDVGGSGKKRGRNEIQADAKDGETKKMPVDGKKKMKNKKPKQDEIGKKSANSPPRPGVESIDLGKEVSAQSDMACNTCDTSQTVECKANSMTSDSKTITPDDKKSSPNAYKMAANHTATASDSMNEQHDKGGMNEHNYCQPIGQDEPIVYSEETLPPSAYKPHQRIYAKDDATGLLYQAMVRKVMWGSKSSQISMAFTSSLVDGEPCGGIIEKEMEESAAAALAAKNEEEEVEDSQRWDPKHNCYHYYVHYMGWAVRWDRWVEETFIYDNSESTSTLAKTLMKEYKMYKPKRKGEKMSIAQVNKWMVRMRDIEAEHREGLVNGEQCNDNANNAGGDEKVVDKMSAEKDNAGEKEAESGETMKEHFQEDVNTDSKKKEKSPKSDNKKITADDEFSNEKITEDDKVNNKKSTADDNANKKKSAEDDKAKFAAKKLAKENLQKQFQLRKDGLQMKRKRSVSDRLQIPFNLKKILVDEWEVLTQCGSVHSIPSKVTVREALNQYLESKLAPLRKQNEVESSGDDKKPSAEVGGDKMQIQEGVDSKTSELGKDWVDMVESIARFFDQALSAHLLFDEERGQYNSLRKQILAQRRNSAAIAAASAASPKPMYKLNNEEASLQSGITNGSAPTEMELLALPGALPKEAKLPPGCRVQSPAVVTDTSTTASVTSLATLSNINAKAPPVNFLPDRMSEVYGCEHLLRLFVRLPGIVVQSPTMEDQSRRTLSQLGDLVRYLQKHQSQLFCASFRKPLPGEVGRVKKTGGKLVKS